jgi:hypothetical protein
VSFCLPALDSLRRLVEEVVPLLGHEQAEPPR